MKKINKEKTIRIGVATLAIPFIMTLSGCNHRQQEKTITKDQIERIAEYNNKINYLNNHIFINKSNSYTNYKDLESAYEGLYREILITSCNLNYTDLQKIEEKSYLEEGKYLIATTDSNYIGKLMSYYGIEETEATWLLRLITSMPNQEELDNNLDKAIYAIETYSQIEEKFINNNKTKVKRK
ncbi:MAG: hypothetical protein VZS44_01685 [Bacilli bacterium]|nr:hypothetical protein [Bacilli bacterium]